MIKNKGISLKTKKIIIILNSIILLFGIITFVGWITGFDNLASIRGRYIPMSRDTALFFILLGSISILLLNKKSENVIKLIKFMTLFIAVYGSFKFAEYFIHFDLTFEDLWLPASEGTDLYPVKRMSPYTGFLYMLSGVAIFLSVQKNNKKVKENISAIFGVIIFLLSFVAVTGYIFDSPLLYGSGIIPIAVNTAIAFMFLGFSIILSTHNSYIVNYVTSNKILKTLLLTFIPLTTILIFIITLLTKVVLQNSTANIGLFTSLVWLITLFIFIVIIIPISKRITHKINRVNTELLLTKSIFENSITNAPLPIMIHKEDGTVLNLSKAWTSSTGYNINDIPTIYEWTEKAYGKNKDEVIDFIKKLYKLTTRQHDGEFVVTTKDGRKLTWDFNSGYIGNLPNGMAVAMSVATDVTEHKQLVKQLKQNEKNLLNSQGIAHLGTWRLDVKTNEVVWTEELYKMYGFDPKLPVPNYTEHMKLFTPESWERLSTALELTRTQGVPYELELETVTKEGSNGWMWVRGEAEKDEDGKIIAIWGAAQDITERNRIKQEISYLSYHDQLTGLYNRRFFEEQLKRLDNPRNLPLSIIMGDVNGLKLVNDAFGHQIGDQLLKLIGDIISTSIRGNDIAARWGGDEFTILMPTSDLDAAEVLINRIHQKVEESTFDYGSLSISFGVETKRNKDEDINDLFKSAETLMYQNKLAEIDSIRGETINTIMNTLFVKSPEVKEHSIRVSELAVSIAESMGLSQSKINDIRTIGMIHDIGKIAIDLHILDKPGELTDDEMKIIQQHPLSGSRMLNSSHEYSRLAVGVLHHHERIDGKGYPNGISGDQIPIESKIIAVADAYDAMTAVRPYRLNPLSKDEAILELQKHSGSQFDETVVDVFVNKILLKNIE